MKISHSLIGLVAFGSLTLSGCVIHVGGHTDGSDLSSVLGGVDVSEGRHVGDISTVNGGVSLETRAQSGTIDTVNGDIELGRYALTRDIDVVNGNVELAKHASVVGSIETVNGDVELAGKNDIDGNIETVNGDIELSDSKVNGNIVTHNGDITLINNSLIIGDIIFEEQHEDSWSRSTPTLTIDDSGSVSGRIILHRKVKLDIPAAMEDKVERHY